MNAIVSHSLAPRPPLPSQVRGNLATLLVLRRNPLELWGPVAYREGVLAGSFLGRRQFLVNDPDAIHQVLVANAARYVRPAATRRILRPVLGDGLFLAEGDSWRHQRRTIAPAMAPRALSLLARHVAEEAASTEATLAADASRVVELLPVLQHLALGIAGRSMFSLEMGRHGHALRRLLFRYARGLAQPGPLDLLLPERIASPTDRRRAAFRLDWIRFIDGLIAERATADRPEGTPRDLFDMLSGARDPETGAAFDQATLRDDVATMILAGHETTAVTLFWSCFLLARFPGWQEELAAEAATVDLSPEAAATAPARLPLLRSHVDEALRLYPPAFLITREATAPDTLGGHAVPAGAIVTVSPFVVHRHERFWTAPDRFEPGRFAKNPPARHTYLPFGAGPRICIGASFAITEAVVVLARLLQRFRLELAPGAEHVLPRGVVTTQPDRAVRFILRPRTATARG